MKVGLKGAKLFRLRHNNDTTMNNLYDKYKNIYKEKNSGEKKNHLNRWIVSYADFVTVLLALFMVFWLGSNFDFQDKVQAKTLQSKIEHEPQKQALAGENHLLDGVKNPSDSKEVKVIEFEQAAARINTALGGKNAVEVIPQGAKIIIRMHDGVLFDEGSAIIKVESVKAIDTVAKELKKSNTKIQIEGHSDNTPVLGGQYSSNWELSTARAVNITRYLIETAGIEKERLSASGYADNRPVASNDTKEGRAKNRRVDIVVTN